MRQTDVDVLIVGGGPAGMVCACLLARAGLDTLVLERNPNFDREFRGEILQPRFHKAMRDLGLYDHLTRYPHEEIDQAHVYFEGRRMGALDLRKLDPASGTTWWMTQPDLLHALREYGQSSPRFHLWFDAALKGLRPGAAVVERNGADEEIRASVIVGADGRYSTVRKLRGIGLEYDHIDLDVIWFLLPRPQGYRHVFSFFLTQHHNYLILPKHPNLLQCGLVLQPGEFAALRQDLERLREELRRAHPVFAEFAAGLRDLSAFRPLKGNTALASHWAEDGLVLIGDAAHTCSPAGGIGVAVAVETACVAADVIRRCFEQRDFSRQRLGEIQARREKDVRAVHAIQRNARFMVRSGGILRRVAPRAIWLLSRTGLLPVLARRLLTQRQPLPRSLQRLPAQQAAHPDIP